MATRPPELSMDAKWEAAIDLTLRRLVYGSLAGGAAGLLLFRAYPTATRMTREKTRPSQRLSRPLPRARPPQRKHRSDARFRPSIRTGGAGSRSATLAFGAGAALGSAYTGTSLAHPRR